MVIQLDRKQKETLRAIMDTFIAPLNDDESLELVQTTPSLSPLSIDEILMQDGKTHMDLTAMAVSCATDIDSALGFLEHALQPSSQRLVLSKLSSLGSSWGAMRMTGHRKPLAHLTRPERELILKRWKHSLPVLYKTLSDLSLYTTYGGDWIPRQQHKSSFSSSSSSSSVTAAPLSMLTTYEAQVLQAITFDAIVIGSGPGGSVVAAQVASAGGSVLVIEKGKHYTQQEMETKDELTHLYDAQGLQCYKSVNLLAPSALGGGTCVDGSISLEPPQSMLDDWTKKSHDHFDKIAFKRDLAIVSGHIGVSTEGIQHDHSNTILKEGCAKLGIPARNCPNNTRGFPYDTKTCFEGTRQGGRRQGTANIWLRDAEAYGVRFMDQTTVTKILTRNKQAIGVQCLCQGTLPCTFTAKIIVVAAGSLHTPILLSKSGLNNKHIGRHLKLHPTSFVHGFYPTIKHDYSEQEGPVTSIHVTESRAATIHATTLAPSLEATLLPWHGSLAHKKTMAKVSQMACLGIYVGDHQQHQQSYNNRVEQDSNDRPLVIHTLGKDDESRLVQGIIRAFRILAISGATELYPSQLGIEPFRFDQGLKEEKGDDDVNAVKDPKFNAWLDRVRDHGLPDGIFSMHQMGTCRMGRNAQTSVTRTTGETWEIDNLFIADGSLFMTSSGVDPMLTIETLAFGISRHIISRLGKRSW